MALKGKFASLFQQRNMKRVIAVILAITMLGGGYWIYASKFMKKSVSVASTQKTAKVMRGNLSVTVSGSGPIATSSKVEVTPKVAGTITKVYFKETDTVKEGDLMFELDDSTAKLNLEKIKNSISDATLTQTNNLTSISKLNIKAPFDGQVSNLTIKEGDVLNKGGAVFTLKDLSRLKIKLPFNASGFGDVQPGMKATVQLQGMMQTVEGTVSYVGNRTYSTTNGGLVFDVEIILQNPGLLSDGMVASASLDTSKGVITSTSTSTLSIINNSVIKTDVAGTIKKINIRDGQFLQQGEVAIEISSDDLLLTTASAEVKLKDLQAQYDSALQDLNYFKIYATGNGTIVKQTKKVGDVVKSGDVISTISDGNQLEFNVSIDELDIEKMKVGQAVKITLDAVSSTASTPIDGEVSKIAIEGTTSSGVTVYPVTIKVKNPKNIKIGMYANATIYIENKQNVLYLPIEAVTKMPRGGLAYVWVRADSTLAATPSGSRPVDTAGSNAIQGTQNMQGGFPSGTAPGTGAAMPVTGVAQDGTARPNRQNPPGGTQPGGLPQGAQSGTSGGTVQGNTGVQGGRPGQPIQGSTGTPGTTGGQQTQGTVSAQTSGQSGSVQGTRSNPSSTNTPSSQSGARTSTTQGTNSYYSNLVRRDVVLGINNESYIEIISGLSEGDEVVLPQTTTTTRSSNSTTRTNGQQQQQGGIPGGNILGGGGVPGGVMR